MSINSIYNVQCSKIPTFKSKMANDDVPVSNPILQQSVTFNGTEALATYNYNLVNKNNDFNISLVKPIEVPSDINEVKGERIYDSAGELIEIVDEDERFKYVYQTGHNSLEKYRLSVVDKNTNKIVKKQYEFKYTMYENPLIDVTEYNGNTATRTAYDSKTLKPTIFDKTVRDGNKEKMISYSFEQKAFDKYEYDKINNIIKRSHYDKQGNLMGEPDIENNSEKYINLEKPTLHPKFQLDYDPKELEGEKRYYSNGVIEENIVNENGKKVHYQFNTNGQIDMIHKDNLTINYFNDFDNSGYSISEDLGNNKSRTTNYLDNGNVICLLEDNGKGVSFNVFCYNVQPGIVIDYATGKNKEE